MKKIYLAGPDVFRKDAIEHGEYLKNLCKKHGFEGLYPFDNEVDFSVQNPDKQIYEANVNMIKDCDIILANLNPFRGPSADVGTVFEVGMGLGLGKIVVGYRDSALGEYKIRVPKDDLNVEDFGLKDNLMIDNGVKIFDSIDQALNYLMNNKDKK